ncbi:TetR/AcrR family transcriptional regulator [Spirillospora sp. CA-294931]|uniref:TetR/AcrR family transcriptional regulator n=1 Tax=Spirillospora sp. CA-294931 TaxID=3240042 RepID=UPI003D940E4A
MVNESSPKTRERTDRRTARWTGHRAERRAALVESAIEAIAEHGPTVSTQQIAEHAGVARPQLYRHFRDAQDLQRAVALRAAELVVAEMAPSLTSPAGTSAQVIEQAVGTLVRWLAGHADLYWYVAKRGGTPSEGSVAADIRETLATQLSALLNAYLTVFGVRTPVTDTLAFGLVGFVESATDRWLNDPGEVSLDQLVGHLSSWVWGVLDHALRSEGVELDPDQPLPSGVLG